MSLLIDSYERRFVYLRLSVTDRCNFRCAYCLPNGYVAPEGIIEPELSLDEFRRLVSAFASLGVWKVRLTGGEPTVRRDIIEIAHAISEVHGIRRVAITTNGDRLQELAIPLRAAGVSALNISVDSLDPKTFYKMTGRDRLSKVLAGIDAAVSAGFESIKINAVLLKNENLSEVKHFMEWVRHRLVSVRFIELMRTGRNGEYFSKEHVSGKTVQAELLNAGWTQEIRSHGDGPANTYRHADYAGSIGIIAPYASDFCQTCNRLRVSARGALRLCLFGEKDEPLRNYLQDDSSKTALVERIQTLVIKKPLSHQLQEGKYGNTWNLAGIGG